MSATARNCHLHFARRVAHIQIMKILLRPIDAGRIFGVGPHRIRQLAVDGQLPVAARTPDGGRLFDRDDIERFVEARLRRRGEVHDDAA